MLFYNHDIPTGLDKKKKSVWVLKGTTQRLFFLPTPESPPKRGLLYSLLERGLGVGSFPS
ncbi:hypothetical protein KSU1_A0063 [Candidatus Jettenia caeni]|uniref:Uncharacterized protein n=1 Tax=Candidatus Jettenia caeni TaxID=247490 RepID=I3IGI5_9BACT|nr:hypothetical protein KSU1_A0063 [Candidatus Jettenia caeni]